MQNSTLHHILYLTGGGSVVGFTKKGNKKKYIFVLLQCSSKQDVFCMTKLDCNELNRG